MISELRSAAMRRATTGVTIPRLNEDTHTPTKAVMTTIIGIDFSGAKGDRNTWVTSGHLSAQGTLQIESAKMTPRQEVRELLLGVRPPAVAGIDFPFALPRPFAEFLSTDPLTTIPDVWRTLSDLSVNDFIAARDAFVHRFGEPKRAGDEAHFRESYSPLHKVNPKHAPDDLLWYQDAPRPPSESRLQVACASSAPAEPQFGAIGYSAGNYAWSLSEVNRHHLQGLQESQVSVARDERRNAILDALEHRSGLELPNLSDFRQECLASDDCLDSVVAAVSAARWAGDPSCFHHPDECELQDAMLEGWIYVPQSAD